MGRSFREAINTATVYTIKLPSGGAFRPDLMYPFMSRMAQSGRMMFRIAADYSSIRFQVVDVQEDTTAGAVKNIALASYPQAAVTEEPLATRPFTRPFQRWVLLFTQHNPFIAPIRYPSQLKGYDPLVTLTNLLSDLWPDEYVTYTLYVGKPNVKLLEEAQKLLERPDWQVWGGILAGAALNMDLNVTKQKYAAELNNLYIQKVTRSVLYPCYIMVEIDSPYNDRFISLGTGAESTFSELSSEFQYLAYYSQTQVFGDINSQSDMDKLGTIPLLLSWQSGVGDLFQQVRSVFNADELASLWHLPYEDFIAPNIARVSSRLVRVPTVVRDNNKGVYLGDNEYAGTNNPVYMRSEDRSTHMIITGRTQMGKSTLIHNLVHQNIEAGHGVAVVDPHGTLIENILRYSIPPERLDDVVVWDLADLEYPPPLNLLAVPDGVDRIDAASQIMKVFETLEKGFAETRMAGSLSDTLEILIFEKGATLRDISRLFSDDKFRAHVLENVDNPATFDFWDEFEEMRPSEQRDLAKPLNHRLRRLYKNRTLYPIICHPDPLDFASLIEQNKIILVSLQTAKGASLSDRELEFLGALMISQIQLAVMADAAKKPFYVYIDEAERFVTTAVDEVLSQAAKRNLSLTLANQYLGQLEGKTLDAVIGNVGAMIFFQIGEKDARTVAPYMRKSLTVDDMVSLDAYHAATIMRFQGHQLPPFTILTRPRPKAVTTPDPTAHIRALSRKKYNPRSRNEVIEWLNERYPQEFKKRRAKKDDDFTEPAN
jgi:Type IV secretion-system coupling protein DNA-binding domain